MFNEITAVILAIAATAFMRSLAAALHNLPN